MGRKLQYTLLWFGKSVFTFLRETGIRDSALGRICGNVFYSTIYFFQDLFYYVVSIPEAFLEWFQSRRSSSYDEEEVPFATSGTGEYVLGNTVRTTRGDDSSEDIRIARDPNVLRGTEDRPKKKSVASSRGSQIRKPQKPRRSAVGLPSTALLKSSEGDSSASPEDEDLIANSKRLEQTLADFRIGGRVVEVHPGPVITLYQFEPAAGMKVQRIVNLADDLALALKVASVRVYAPVPGRGTVGIEVPNAEREIVRLRDVLECPTVTNSESILTLAIGKTTFGEPYAADLAKMPHLLIAGATGSGKSVCINSLLLSLLYRNTPDELRLLLIDPKMLELSLYEGVPHLKSPVVTNPKRARGVFWWAVEEMERRYQLMKEKGVRNFASYNQAVTAELRSDDDEGVGVDTSSENDSSSAEFGEQLPRIVIVVDELADLMLTVGREIEELMTRLAQKAQSGWNSSHSRNAAPKRKRYHWID